MSKALVNAFAEGAQARRGGIRREFAEEIYSIHSKHPQPFGTMRVAWWGGWDATDANPGRVFTGWQFGLVFDEAKLKKGTLAILAEHERTIRMPRSKKQLDELKAAYRSETYDAYAADATAKGQEPQSLDEAFAAHLAALDAAEPAPAAKPAKAAKAKAEPKAKKAPAFRPTSDDRKAINAAAAKALGKVEGTPRCVPSSGGTYTDFLQGKVLKLDAEGNGSTTLNVVTAKAKDTVVGSVLVTVAKGAMTVKPVKS